MLVEIGERLVTAAVVRGDAADARGRTAELPANFADLEEDARVRALGDALRGCGVTDRRFSLVLPRRRSILREFTLPPGEPEELQQMIRYQLERDLPVPVEDVRYSYVASRAETGGSRVTVAAVPKEVLNPLLSMLEGLGFQPANVFISCFGLATWAPVGRGSVAVVGLSNGHTEIVVADGGTHLYSRSAPLAERSGESIATEIQRTLLSFSAAFPDRKLDRVVLAAGGEDAETLASAVSAALGRPVETLGPVQLTAEAAGPAGVGLAAARAPGSIPDVLNPPVIRKRWKITRVRGSVIAGAVMLVALIVAAQVSLAGRERILEKIEGELKVLEPRVQKVREVLDRGALARQWDDQRYPWVDFLGDLSDRIDRSQVHLLSAQFGDDGNVRLAGKAQSEAFLNELLGSLKGSKFLTEANFEYRRRNKDRYGYILDFAIQGRLAGLGGPEKKK